jgi:biotin carboxylase
MGRADSYEALMKLVNDAGLGNDLVVQTPYGDSGRTTFFISSESDWDKYASKMIDEDLKIMKRINHIPGTLEAVATRHGTLVGPMMTDITGFAELTPYKGGWCGNDVSAQLISKKLREKIQSMASALGERLYQEGYRGVFCLDFLIDTDNDEVYLGEINPRISGASPPTNLITSKYGGVPLMLFHLLEFSDVDYEIDMQSIQSRWTDYDAWSQLVLKQTEDKVELISNAPQSGIWRMNDDDKIEFVRQTIDWHNVGDENEAYYMRVYGAGEYRYHGADMGILVSRGRMQTDDRELRQRAKTWASQIIAQFEGVAPPPEAPVIPPDIDFRKMF